MQGKNFELGNMLKNAQFLLVSYYYQFINLLDVKKII